MRGESDVANSKKTGRSGARRKRAPRDKAAYGKAVWQSGYEARKRGEQRSCPLGDYPSQAAESWGQGWDAANAELAVHAQEPEVRTTAPAAPSRRTHPHLFAPEGYVDPGAYVRLRTRLACPECDRVLTDGGSQAVVLRATSGPGRGGDIAYLGCRACEHRWQLPIQEA